MKIAEIGPLDQKGHPALQRILDGIRCAHQIFIAHGGESRMLRQRVGNRLIFHPGLQVPPDFLVRIVAPMTAAREGIPGVAQHVNNVQFVVDTQWKIDSLDVVGILRAQDFTRLDILLKYAVLVFRVTVDFEAVRHQLGHQGRAATGQASDNMDVYRVHFQKDRKFKPLLEIYSAFHLQSNFWRIVCGNNDRIQSTA